MQRSFYTLRKFDDFGSKRVTCGLIGAGSSFEIQTFPIILTDNFLSGDDCYHIAIFSEIQRNDFAINRMKKLYDYVGGLWCFIKIRTWLCIFGDCLAIVKCIARIVFVCTVQIRQHHGGNSAACRPRFHRILWVLLQCIQRGVRNFAYIVYPFIVYADRKPAVAFIVCRVGSKTLRVQGIALRQGSLRRCLHISCLRYHSFLFCFVYISGKRWYKQSC